METIYEDENLLVIDKPAGIIVFNEQRTANNEQRTLIDLLIEKYPELKNAGKPPRYGILHRLDKDTSGILLVAKNNRALDFFQKQFLSKEIEKKYTALAIGKMEENQGRIETFLGRSPNDRRKQKVFSELEAKELKQARKAVTEYKVLQRFEKYTLLEVKIKTGRKHQIRSHFAHLHHPLAGDKLYGFKGQSCPEGLERQFLHASYLKAKMPDGKVKEFQSGLPEDLQKALNKLISNYD